MNRRVVPMKVVIALLSGLVVGWVGLNTGGCGPDESDQAIIPYPPPEKLVVITPHNPLIQELFRSGFSDWHQEHYGQYVDIQWLTMGTVECLRYIESVAGQEDATGRKPIPDLLFGGGITDHNFLVKRRLAQPIDIKDALERVPERIMGLSTRDPQGRWHATALSGFGILYHKEGCLQRTIPEPTTWADLAKSDFYGWVSMADPTRSGSNRQCLTLILQKHRWKEGWGIILRMAANSRALLHHSADVISDVSAGVAIAGLTVNFTALHEIELRGENRLAYVSPRGSNVITPDLITVLNFAPKLELAERFVRFCLSENGQVLWGVKAEERQGYRDTLFRYPVDPKIYESYAGKLWAPDNPLTMKSDVTINLETEQKQANIVAPLLLAACGENHIRLQNCWQRIIESGMHAGALAELIAPPFGEEAAYELGAKFAADGAEAKRQMEDWSKSFRTKYEKVMSMLPS